MFSVKRKIFIALTVIWMTVIFLFSSKNADASSADSSFVGDCLGHFFCDGYDNMASDERLVFIEMVEYPIRKTAHFLEYAMLGFLLLGCADFDNKIEYCEKKKKIYIKNRLIFMWLTGTVYAVTDEIHQLFVPGRSCQLTDVLLDSIGVLAGVMLMSIFVRKRCKNYLED